MAVDLKRVPPEDRAAVGKLTRQSEASFQKQVIDYAIACGWLVHAERPARRGEAEDCSLCQGQGYTGDHVFCPVCHGTGSVTRWATPIQGDRGFPDLVLAHPSHGVIFAELKSQSGVLSKAQREWQLVLGQKTDQVYVWRPSDWPELERVLKG